MQFLQRAKNIGKVVISGSLLSDYARDGFRIGVFTSKAVCGGRVPNLS